MNALSILNEMKRNHRALLWLNAERREACIHDGEIARPVDYAEAKMARTDPAMRIIDTTDGETLAA